MAYNTRNSKKFYKCFFPLQIYLAVIGQMPYTNRKMSDGTERFRFRYLSFKFARYIIVVIIYSILYVWVTTGILSFMLGYNESHVTTVVMDAITKQQVKVSYERALVRDQMVPIYVVWSWLTMVIIPNISLLFRGRDHVHFMNYWSRCVCIIDTDCTRGVEASMWWNNVFVITILVLLSVIFCIGHLKNEKASGILSTSDVFTLFVARNLMTDKKMKLSSNYRVIGFVIIAVAYVGSRALITQFIFFQKLLKNMADVWCHRLTNALEGKMLKEKGNQATRRTDHKRLLKDFMTITQIYRFTNNTFNFSISVFFTLTLISLVLELYHIAIVLLIPLTEYSKVTYLPARDGGMMTHELQDSQEIRENEETDEAKHLQDFILSCLMLVYQAVTCYKTISETASASEAVQHAHRILRRHGFMFCHNKTERNFMWNMFLFFYKRPPGETTISGYMIINRALLGALCLAIINYSVSMYQLKPEAWHQEDLDIPEGPNPQPFESIKEFFRMLPEGEYLEMNTAHL